MRFKIVGRIGWSLLIAGLLPVVAQGFVDGKLTPPSWLDRPPSGFPGGKVAHGQVSRSAYNGHAEAYLVRAWWALDASPTPPNPPTVTREDQLIEVTLVLGGSVPRSGPLAVTISTLGGEKADVDLAREALSFFWTLRANATGAGPPPWLNLPSAALTTAPGALPTFPVDDSVLDPPNFRPWVPDKMIHRTAPQYVGLERLLDFWRQVGVSCRGRVQWLAEPGAGPAGFVFVWWPEDDPWRKPLLMAPRVMQPIPLEVAEPLISLPGQRNFARLPPGTMALLEPALMGSKQLVALGREGLVLFDPATGLYEVSLRKSLPGQPPLQYQPIRLTRGLSQAQGPPRWAAFTGNLKQGWRPDEARHLMGLGVCGPDVWRVRRVDAPGEAGLPLFADPELWALFP